VPHRMIQSCYTGRWRVVYLVQPQPRPVPGPPRCTNCASPPINCQCTNHRIANASLLCGFNVHTKG